MNFNIKWSSIWNGFILPLSSGTIAEWTIKNRGIVYIIYDIIWSIGYFVSTAGINEENIRKYIEMKGKEDRGQAKLEF